MKSAIYHGSVRHRRRAPTRHDFTYPLFMMYLDLAELPGLFEGRWLWSATRPAPAWFRRADYLGDPNDDLDGAVRDTVADATGRRPAGPIRMLTHLRYLGFLMNPVTFYYCFDSDESVEAIVAEITNTPWRERHSYVLSGGPQEDPVERPHRFAKAFHISPFMAMDQEYVWRFAAPGDRLFVHMENREAGEKVFDATLHLRREEITGRSLAAALLRHPWMTARVGFGIYWQALVLRLKGTPYHEHPAPAGARS